MTSHFSRSSLPSPRSLSLCQLRNFVSAGVILFTFNKIISMHTVVNQGLHAMPNTTDWYDLLCIYNRHFLRIDVLYSGPFNNTIVFIIFEKIEIKQYDLLAKQFTLRVLLECYGKPIIRDGLTKLINEFSHHTGFAVIPQLM